MALKSKTARGQLGAATAVLLAANATKNIYVRSVHFKNNSAAMRKVSYAMAATATSAGPGIFEEALPPNTSGQLSRMDVHYGGKGHRLDNTAVSGMSDAAASVTYEINYDESDGLDAS